jgi:crotonobetainyl-CoA:carnitine CoA-transferase CaiB-like acyl-CoA transferase
LGAVDVPVSPINRLEEVMVDPQVLHNGMMLELAHPRHGAVHTVSNPVHLEATPAAPHGYPPGLGQHTDAILSELGYAAEAIAALRGDGTVR